MRPYAITIEAISRAVAARVSDASDKMEVYWTYV